MRYLAIDIETTGIDPLNDMILEFAAIFMDTKVDMPIEKRPFVKWTVYKEGPIVGSPYALALNQRLLQEYVKIERGTAKIDSFIWIDQLTDKFYSFLIDNDYEPNKSDKINIVCAGKNFAGFDNLFLKHQVPGWTERISVSNRVLDPALLYTDLDRDVTAPSTKTCMKRCPDIDIEEVPHDAYDDSVLIIKMLEAVRLGRVPQPFKLPPKEDEGT